MSGEKIGSCGPREQTTEPRKKIERVLRENRPSGGTVNHPGDWEQWISETTAELVEALGLTEEWGVQRVLSKSATPRESESWCRERAEFLNDRYGPGEASVVSRWVSGWSVVGGEPSE